MKYKLVSSWMHWILIKAEWLHAPSSKACSFRMLHRLSAEQKLPIKNCRAKTADQKLPSKTSRATTDGQNQPSKNWRAKTAGQKLARWLHWRIQPVHLPSTNSPGACLDVSIEKSCRAPPRQMAIVVPNHHLPPMFPSSNTWLKAVSQSNEAVKRRHREKR